MKISRLNALLIFTVMGKLFLKHSLPGSRGLLHSGPLDFACPIAAPLSATGRSMSHVQVWNMLSA